MAADRPETFFPFERRATALREQEFARLADAVPPTLQALRALTPPAFRVEVAVMLERLGYTVITDPGAGGLTITKEGQKYLVACASPADPASTPAREMARLHSAVVAANAHRGFYVTTRGFTADAQVYAGTAPIQLIDGVKLVAAMERSRAGISPPTAYKAMCQHEAGSGTESRPPGRASVRPLQ